MRHGETDWNRELRFQGQVDAPLNAIGQAQAMRIAQRLATQPANYIYSSDLSRASQTAASIVSLHEGLAESVAPKIEVDLREQAFGVVDGMRVDDIKQAHAQAWERWLEFNPDFTFDGGETTRVFHARVLQAVQRLRQAHEGQTLIVVTHGGVLDMLWRTARELPLDGPRTCEIPNAGLNRLRLHSDGIDILDWADTSHLQGMPPQPVYDQTRLKPVQANSDRPSA